MNWNDSEEEAECPAKEAKGVKGKAIFPSRILSLFNGASARGFPDSLR